MGNIKQLIRLSELRSNRIQKMPVWLATCSAYSLFPRPASSSPLIFVFSAPVASISFSEASPASSQIYAPLVLLLLLLLVLLPPHSSTRSPSPQSDKTFVPATLNAGSCSCSLVGIQAWDLLFSFESQSSTYSGPFFSSGWDWMKWLVKYGTWLSPSLSAGQALSLLFCFCQSNFY